MVSSDSTFRVVAHMKGAAIIQGSLTLESLLAACANEQTGKIRDDALADVPIGYTDTPEGRVWQATSAMVDGKYKTTEHTVVRGRHFTEVGPEFYDPNPRARKDGWACEDTKGPYMRLLKNYPLIEASRLVWYARGDAARCLELLETQSWLGKRRGSGMGEVAGYTVEAWSGNPVVDTHGMVRRPVALRKLPHVPGALDAKFQRKIHTVDNHPSWAHDAELCAVPPNVVEPRDVPEMFFED